MATGKSSTQRTAANKGANRSTATKSSKKEASSSRKYSPKASEYVEEEMKEMKQGKLKSGRGGKKVRNTKQAIAIGLSKARKSGEKVPPNPHDKAA